jgi:hypothetical protein
MHLERERSEAAAPWRGRQPARSETVIDAGLEYRPGDPVRVRVVRRERRTPVTDDGAAVEMAGRPARWREAVERLNRDLMVNVSQRGVVSLPVVAVGPGVETIVRRIAEASLGFYQELLELDDTWPHTPVSLGLHGPRMLPHTVIAEPEEDRWRRRR